MFRTAEMHRRLNKYCTAFKGVDLFSVLNYGVVFGFRKSPTDLIKCTKAVGDHRVSFDEATNEAIRKAIESKRAEGAVLTVESFASIVRSQRLLSAGVRTTVRDMMNGNEQNARTRAWLEKDAPFVMTFERARPDPKRHEEAVDVAKQLLKRFQSVKSALVTVVVE